MIYLLTAIGLSPSGSTHLHTNNTQNNTNNNRTTQIQANVEECGPCPVFASFTLAFALQLRKKHGKTSLKVQYTSSSCSGRIRFDSCSLYPQYEIGPSISSSVTKNTHTLQNPLIHTQTHTQMSSFPHLSRSFHISPDILRIYLSVCLFICLLFAVSQCMNSKQLTVTSEHSPSW